jgi:hypothetical protein
VGQPLPNDFWNEGVLMRVCRARGPAGYDRSSVRVALGVAAIGLLVPASTRSLLRKAFYALLEAVAAGVFEAILTVAVATGGRGRRRR